MPQRTNPSMAERGLLDTSVVVDHDVVDPALLPDESAISAVTLAELAAVPHVATDEQERARRLPVEARPPHLTPSSRSSETGPAPRPAR
jgi:predicted nucleic acid-binding protein